MEAAPNHPITQNNTTDIEDQLQIPSRLMCRSLGVSQKVVLDVSPSGDPVRGDRGFNPLSWSVALVASRERVDIGDFEEEKKVEGAHFATA